jgi:hypothetical protein
MTASMAEMVVLVPSRGRPQNIVDLVHAWIRTKATAALYVLVDDDDPRLLDYLAIGMRESTFPFTVIEQPARRLGPTLNYWAIDIINNIGSPQSTPKIIGFMGDDHRPRTEGWDARICAALAARPGVAYGNDLLQGANLPTAAFISTVLIDALGYMVPRGLIHMYLDNFWKELGTNLDALHYLDDIIIEHMHFLNGKAELDEGYARVNAPAMYAHDKRVFENYMRFDFQTALNKAIASIGGE